MDIQVASNFERLLFDLYDRDGKKLAAEMEAFRKDGRMVMGANSLAQARDVFAGHRVDDDETLATIAAVHKSTGEVLDPHTAVAVAGVRATAATRDPSLPTIALATAHPAKFPDAVEKAIGQRPVLPPQLADLLRRPERMTVLPNALAPLKDFVRAQVLSRKDTLERKPA